MTPEKSPWLRRRLPMLLILGGAFFVWRDGFGFFATERRLEWRLPVAYADIRALDVQLWRDDTLVKREERHFGDEGVTQTIESVVSLSRGDHRAVAIVELRDHHTRIFSRVLDPLGSSVVVVAFEGPSSVR